MNDKESTRLSDEKIKKEILKLLNKESRAVNDLEKIATGPSFIRAVDRLSQVEGKLIIAGVGKSGYIGMKIAATLTSLGVPTIFLHPSEALHGDLGIIAANDGLIAISHNGETEETLKIVRHAANHKLPIVAITGKPSSSLAKMSDVALVFKINGEGSPFNLAPMTSTTTTLVVGDLLATALSLKKGFTKKDFAVFHPAGVLGLQLKKVEEFMIKGNKLPVVKQDDILATALKKIANRKLGITAVINKVGKLVGVIADGDVRRFLLSGRQLSQKSKAADVMTKNPKTIQRKQSLHEALIKMEQCKITSLIVVNKTNKPEGLIHLRSVLEAKIG